MIIATPSLIRAMANVIVDQKVDPWDGLRVGVMLIKAGFLAKEIDACWEPAMAMAAIRMQNEKIK